MIKFVCWSMKPFLRIVLIGLLTPVNHSSSFEVHLPTIVHWIIKKKKISINRCVNVRLNLSLPFFKFNDRSIFLLDNTFKFFDQLFSISRSIVRVVHEDQLMIVIESFEKSMRLAFSFLFVFLLFIEDRTWWNNGTIRSCHKIQ